MNQCRIYTVTILGLLWGAMLIQQFLETGLQVGGWLSDSPSIWALKFSTPWNASDFPVTLRKSSMVASESSETHLPCPLAGATFLVGFLLQGSTGAITRVNTRVITRVTRATSTTIIIVIVRSQGLYSSLA